MKTNYKPRIASPYQMTQEKTFRVRDKKSPVQEEIEKNTGTFNISVEVKEDKETISSFKHISNLVSFITTLKNEKNEVVGIGRGSAVVNRLNKFIERTVRFAYNASLIDAMVRSTKILDALYITPVKQENIEVPDEADLEGRDRPAFFGDEDMPKIATEKQREFLNRLIDEKCDDDSTKEEYLGQLNSPYLSKFDCSNLINSLLTQ